jgi:hypothetical protein
MLIKPYDMILSKPNILLKNNVKIKLKNMNKITVCLLIAITINSLLLLPAATQGSINTSTVLASSGYIQSNPTPTATPTVTPTITSTPTPTRTPTPTPTPTGSYSYIMDISGSNYRILNSARSAIYSSTSSSAAFNWLLGWGGHASSGNTVYVQAGAYSVDSTWVIAISGVTVVFQSPMPSSPNIMGNYVGSGTTSSANGAILTAVANLNTWIMAVYGNNVVISGLTEDGNAVNQYGGTWTYPSTNPYNSIGGVYVEANNVLIKYSTIHDMRSWGVSINGDYNGVTNSLIYRIGANGYTTSSWTVVHTGNFVVNSEVYACSDVGLCSQSENTVFTGNYVHDIAPMGQTHGQMDSYWAIAWESTPLEHAGGSGSGTYALCANNLVVNAQSAGIIVSDQGTISNVLISGNTVINCQGAYGAIAVYGSNNIVEYNTVS